MTICLMAEKWSINQLLVFKKNLINISILKLKKKQFIKNRDNRDKTLKSPRLLLQSLQVNIDAGKLPVKEKNKQRYLKIPINQK